MRTNELVDIANKIKEKYGHLKVSEVVRVCENVDCYISELVVDDSGKRYCYFESECVVSMYSPERSDGSISGRCVAIFHLFVDCVTLKMRCLFFDRFKNYALFFGSGFMEPKELVFDGDVVDNFQNWNITVGCYPDPFVKINEAINHYCMLFILLRTQNYTNIVSSIFPVFPDHSVLMCDTFIEKTSHRGVDFLQLKVKHSNFGSVDGFKLCAVVFDPFSETVCLKSTKDLEYSECLSRWAEGKNFEPFDIMKHISLEDKI